MHEMEAVVELLRSLASDSRVMTLFVLLATAAVTDYRTYRIPNWLSGGGTLIGLAYAAFAPIGAQPSLAWAIAGMLLGLLLLLPFYLLRVMGAGDVKLMAMAGAFLGLDQVAYAAVISLIAGGAAALCFALLRRAFGRMLGNIRLASQAALISVMSGMRPHLALTPAQSIGKLPFGVSIAAGTIGFVIARHVGLI